VRKFLAGNNKQKVKSGPKDPKDFDCCSYATMKFDADSDVLLSKSVSNPSLAKRSRTDARFLPISDRASVASAVVEAVV